MKSLLVILALLSGVLFGSIALFIHDHGETSRRWVMASLFFLAGFAANYWGKPLAWKSLVFFQVPFLAIIVWQLTYLNPFPIEPPFVAWIWAVVWFLLMAAASSVKIRLRTCTGTSGQ